MKDKKLNTKKLCDIVCPEDIEDLERYCREEEVIINHCYGYYRPNCPKTCHYAVKLNRAIN